ncbi:YdcF family protein [Rubripirellula sp.]|nr:YdcF family protein [Rubripirellula sp.]
MTTPSENKLDLRRWKTLILVFTAGLISLSVVFLLLGKTISEKLLTELVMPLGVIWLALSLQTAVLIHQKSYRAAFLSALTWILCTVAGNTYVSTWMMRSLEQPYFTTDPLKREPLEAVVLLGGATSEAPNGQIQINQNGDRVVLAARMYHGGLTKRIICTGARIQGLSVLKMDEAQASRRLLIDLGVEPSAIETYGGRNTSEEMSAIAKELGSATEVGIITSAWHLPRTMTLAERTGIRAIPLPSNFNSGSMDQPPTPTPIGKILLRCIPNQSALSTTSRVVREFLGRLVKR